MSITRSIVKNTMILSIGQLISKPLFVIYVAVLARYVKAEGIGQITSAQALCGVAFVLVSLGFDALVTRDVSADRGRTALYMIGVSVIKLILGLGAIMVLFFVASVGYSPETQKIIMLYGFLSLLGAIYSTIRAIFQAHELMVYDVALQLGRDLLNIGLSLLAIYLSASLVVIVGISLLATAVQLVVAWPLLRRLKVPLLAWPAKAELHRILISALPFSAFVLIAVAGNNVTTAILSVTASEQEVGLYGAALNIGAVMTFFTGTFGTAIFPVLSRLSAISTAKASMVFGKSFELLFIACFPLAVLSILMARPMVELLYGPGFVGVVPVFQVLSLAIVGMSGFACGAYLNASGRQTFYAKRQGVFVAVQIVLSLILVPRFGIMGAAGSFVIPSLLGFVFYTLSCYHFSNLPLPWTLFAKVLFATTIITLGSGFLFHLGLHFILVGILAVLLYGVFLVVFRIIPKEEWAILWGALFSRLVSPAVIDGKG